MTTDPPLPPNLDTGRAFNSMFTVDRHGKCRAKESAELFEANNHYIKTIEKQMHGRMGAEGPRLVHEARERIIRIQTGQPFESSFNANI